MENDSQGNDYALKFLAAMEAKYVALGNAIASVKIALNMGALTGLGATGDPAGAAPVATASGVPLPRGAFLGKSIADAIRIYLNAVRSRKGNREIAIALKEGGAVSTGNFDNRINGALFQLKNRGEVLRFDDGWGLAEWYPESFRNKVAEKTVKTPATAKTKTKKKKATRERATKAPVAEGLQQRIESLLRSEPTRVIPSEEIAATLGVKLAVVNLSLGKMTSAKDAKIAKWQNGYQISGTASADNVHEMKKAV